MDPIDYARRGDVDFFENIIPINDLEIARDKDGNSLLSIAAKENHLECCREIYQRCPSLLYHQSNNGSTALHCATSEKRLDIVKDRREYLITAEEEINKGGQIIHDDKLLTMVNKEGKSALHLAVHVDSLEIVKLLLDTSLGKVLLAMVNEKGNTVLHKAVYDHNFEIAEYLIEFDVNHKYCANKSGKTPLLLAIKIAGSNQNRSNSRSAKIRKLLLEKQPWEAMCAGKNDWTALHYATNKGDLNAIEDVIRFSPDCLQMVDKDGRNFLHIAVMNGSLEVVNLVLGTKEIAVASVLNVPDGDGNTPLHIAALRRNDTVTERLLYHPSVSKNTINNKGQDVLDAITFEYDRLRDGASGSRGLSQTVLKEQSEFDLVVSALIAAVSFTSGITVPGGYHSDGPDIGRAVLSDKASFFVFVISNNFALLFSLSAVFSHFSARRLPDQKKVISQLHVATFCTLGAIFSMMIAFIAGSYTVLASSNVLAIVACAQCCCFCSFAIFAMWVMRTFEARSWMQIVKACLTRKKTLQTPPTVATSV